MSNISPDFIHNVGYLYEEINVQQQDFLNEDSEYYDSEAAELVEDILSSISLSMIHEGYSASAVIGFLSDSTEEDILEKYLSFDDNILSESSVDEDYIQEQLELLENRLRAAASLGKAAFKTLFGKGPGYAATKLQGPRAPGLVDKAKVVTSKAIQKVKDIATKAKPVLQKVGKGAGIFGLGAAGGFVGAKMAGAGSKTAEAPKPPTAKSAPTPKPAQPAAQSVKPSAPSSSAGTRSSSNVSGAGTRKSSGSSTSAKPAGQTGDKAKDMETWAKANPTLAAKVKPGQSGYDVISRMREKPSSYEKQDQTPTQGSSTAQINTNSIEADIKAEQERTKKRMEQQKSSTTTTKESYEPYDIVLDYLIDCGHADSLEEAHYIMLEMDESAVGVIMEEYENYILAEEVSEWVDGLLEEGYDLSEYTWDDIIEYYVSESRKH